MDNFGAGPAGFLRKEFSDRELSRKEHSRINGRGQRGLPFYMAYPELLFQEDAVTRDLEYLIQLYPEQAEDTWRGSAACWIIWITGAA